MILPFFALCLLQQASAAPLALPAPSSAAEPAGAVLASGAPTDAMIVDAIRVGVVRLLQHQEEYEPDPPVGSIDEAELAAWQQRERERLSAHREQHAPGREWPYEGVYRVGAGGRIPSGYRVGGTAIASLALLEAPGWNESPQRRAAVKRGAEFMLETIESDPTMAPGPKKGYDVRGWGHVYALRFFLRAIDLDVFEDGKLVARIQKTLPHLVYCIAENEEPGGGWNYAGGRLSPFMTGSTLIALFHAVARGYEVDAAMIERALDALESGRVEAGAFAYSGAVTGEVAMPGSSARAAISELCLFRAGRSSVDRLRVAIIGFFDGWDDLFDRKSKQGTHEGPYGIAPYYFFYGHTYAAIAIEHLPEAERVASRDRLRALVWRTREDDGSWNDRVFPRTSSYSTAMSMLALLAPQLPTVEPWVGPVPR